MQRFGGIVIAKLGGDDLPLRMFFFDFGFGFLHPLVLVGHRRAGVEKRYLGSRLRHLLFRHLDQQAAKLLRRALIDIDAAALRPGIGIPGQDFHPALHRPLQRRAQAVRRNGGDDNRVVALVDEVVDKLHLAGDAGLGGTVIGDIHTQRFPRLFRAVAAAGKEADADQLRNKGDAVRRLRGNHAHRQRQHDQF